ncbi:MAG: hypothetical protein RL441_1251 [Actinomycetota bacterium]
MTGTVTSFGDLSDGEGRIAALLWPELDGKEPTGTRLAWRPLAHAPLGYDGSFILRLSHADVAATHLASGKYFDVRLIAWTLDGKETTFDTSLRLASAVGGNFTLAPTSLGIKSTADGTALRIDSPYRNFDVAAALTLMPFNVCSLTKLDERNRWAVVGDGFPATNSTQKSSFYFSNTETVTAAIAFSSSGAYGDWQQSGSSTESYSFSQNWSASDVNRSYAVQAIMVKVREDCTVYSGGSVYSLPSTQTWKMVGLTGGTAELSSTYYPTWGNCVPISSGEWHKKWNTGSNYTNSGGLKMQSLIGIDLSTTVAQSTVRELTLHQPINSNFEACGNNSYPSSASRVHGR